MSFSYRKLRREKVLKRCAQMRAAKENKRVALAQKLETEVVGTVTFDGPFFGGRHTVRVAAVNDGRPRVDWIVDGMLAASISARRAPALLARMMAGY